MKVVLFGGTGMIGKGVLLEALDDPEVERVLAVGRRPTGVPHPKLQEAVVPDVGDLSSVHDKLAGYDACFYCLGVSSMGLTEAEYARVSYDYPLAAANAMLAANPSSVFVFVTGMGADSTEKGRTMWARVKGRAENALLAMPFRAAYMFRPGFIRPEWGITSRMRGYRIFYAITAPVAALMARAMPDAATTTTRMGQAMLEVASRTPPDRLVETRRINQLAEERIDRRGLTNVAG